MCIGKVMEFLQWGDNGLYFDILSSFHFSPLHQVISPCPDLFTPIVSVGTGDCLDQIRADSSMDNE